MFCSIVLPFRLLENFAYAKSRINALKESKVLLENELKRLVAYHRSLDREMNTIKPDVIQLCKKREQSLS